MKVLIIGGMGVIGGAIAEAATQQKHDVYIVSRRELFGKWRELSITGIQGDWRDDTFAKKVVSTFYDVIVDTQIFNKKQLIRSLALINHHCTQFFYISTDSVYGHPAENINEDVEINLKELKWKYGYDKREAELYLILNGYKYSFYWTVIRPTITFGDTRIPVGFSTKRNTYTLADRMLKGKPILLFDDIDSRHAVCHVSIFGSAVVELFCQERAAGQFYHISDDQSYSYAEIFDAIEKVLGVKGKYVHVKTKSLKKYSRSSYEEMIFDKNPNFTLNNQKIKSMSHNTTFHVDMSEAMTSTLLYLKENGEMDREYDMISDLILLKLGKKISDSLEKEIVRTYLRGLSKEYINALRKYNIMITIKNLLRGLKAMIRPIKNVVLIRH